MYKLISLLFLTLLLVGCATPPQPVAVTKVETKVIKLPNHLKTPCFVTAPPDRTTYPTLTYRQKEDMMTVYAINLLNDLKNCNIKIEQINSFEEEQIQLLKEGKK